MANRFPSTVVAIASLAVLTVVMPAPMVVDLLGAGLASLGLGMIFEGASGL